MYSNKQAFTLIELLVILLIIGILTAVALPQYQVAVAKSRYATVMSQVKHGKNMLELYYLANGKYPDSLQDTDFEVEGCTFPQTDAGKVHACSKGYYYHYIPKNYLHGVIGDTVYTQYLDHSSYPGLIICLAKPDKQIAQKVCRSVGGKLKGEENGWTVYRL